MVALGSHRRKSPAATSLSLPILKEPSPSGLISAMGMSGAPAPLSDLDLVRLAHPEVVGPRSLSPGPRQRDALHRANLEAAAAVRADADARRSARRMSRPASAPPPLPPQVADASAAAAKPTVVLHMPTAASLPPSDPSTAAARPSTAAARVLHAPSAAPTQPHPRPPSPWRPPSGQVASPPVEQASSRAAVAVAATTAPAAVTTRPPMAQAKGVVYTMATPRPMAAHASRAALVVRHGGGTEANAALAYLSRTRPKASGTSPVKTDANGRPATRPSTSPLASVQTLSLATSTPNAMRVVASLSPTNIAAATATTTAAAATTTANDATPQPPPKSPYRSRAASPPRPPSPPQLLPLAPFASAAGSRSSSPVDLFVPAKRPASASALASRSGRPWCRSLSPTGPAAPLGAARAAARVEAMGLWLGTSVQNGPNTLSPWLTA